MIMIMIIIIIIIIIIIMTAMMIVIVIMIVMMMIVITLFRLVKKTVHQFKIDLTTKTLRKYYIDKTVLKKSW